MSAYLKKLMSDYGIGAIIILLIVAYCVYAFASYLGAKGTPGSENNSQMQPQYKASTGVMPSEPLGQNEVFASADGIQTSMPNMPVNAAPQNIQNPAELLPKDQNSQWGQLNPAGKGELENINLLKAGYHYGINTVGQSLRNANLQIRSDPIIPQIPVGPWNQSTMEPDYMRPPFEIGVGQ